MKFLIHVYLGMLSTASMVQSQSAAPVSANVPLDTPEAHTAGAVLAVDQGGMMLRSSAISRISVGFCFLNIGPSISMAAALTNLR